MDEEGIQWGFRWEGELMRSSKEYPVFACQFLIITVRVMRNLLFSAQHEASFSLRIGKALAVFQFADQENIFTACYIVLQTLGSHPPTQYYIIHIIRNFLSEFSYVSELNQKVLI